MLFGILSFIKLLKLSLNCDPPATLLKCWDCLCVPSCPAVWAFYTPSIKPCILSCVSYIDCWWISSNESLTDFTMNLVWAPTVSCTFLPGWSPLRHNYSSRSMVTYSGLQILGVISLNPCTCQWLKLFLLAETSLALSDLLSPVY